MNCYRNILAGPKGSLLKLFTDAPRTAQSFQIFNIRNPILLRSNSTIATKPNNLEKYIAKSKYLTKLSTKPAFEPFFNNLKKSQPVPTITSFLILHEFTAIVPLFVLWYAIFEYLDDTTSEDELTETEKNSKFLQKLPEGMQQNYEKWTTSIKKIVGKYYEGNKEQEVVFSGVLAYGIVKLLYPARVLVSLYFAPAMGKSMTSLFKIFKK
ncbi:hypothetical protein ACO0QE_002562 [Hanseniaspora vineae]